jgi:hypothetical protein
MVRDFHATRNDYLLNSKVNITFDDTHHMNKRQFADWVVSLRKEIVYAWDKLDTPPKLGMTDDQIVKDFERLVNLDVSTLKKYDQQTNGWHCLTAPPNTGSGCLSFFPNIQKTKDIQGKNLTGYSLYDLFVDDDNLEKLTNSLKRLYQADKLYAFSRCVFADNAMGEVSASTGKDWIAEFQSSRPKGWDFFIEIVPNNTKDKMPQGKLLSLSKKDIIELQGRGLLNKKHLTQVVSKDVSGASKHRIRLFQKNQKVIEKGIRFWNTSLVQGGSNFPPTIAKFIYTHFTEDLKKQEHIIVYDPSSGFGGRILGALSVNEDRHIHYVGTDPNPDNFLPEIDRTRYEYLGTYFNSHIRRKHKTSYDLYTEGSEVIHKNKRFQGYKGKIDFVFTSPPYFAAEGYSEDENQSFKKFPNYSDWRDGFLQQTLKTAVEYLKRKRYLAFNIADVAFSGNHYPLEQDTLDILKELGMEYRGKFKMVLAISPGSNKMDTQSRLPTTKNFTQVNGIWRKYEPIFYFWKP